MEFELIRDVVHLGYDDADVDYDVIVGYTEFEAGYEEPVEWPVFQGERCDIIIVQTDEILF